MLTPDQIPDFVNLTLSVFKRHQWTDISLEFPEYIASDIINEKSVKEQGGKDISFRLKTRNTGLARNSGAYAQDVTGVEDVTISGSTPWSMQTVNWSYDVAEEIFQSDRETIVNELVIREHDARSDMAELNEENMWSAPTSTTDKRPRGIPFWLTKDATTDPDGDFNGSNPTGFSTGRAGIDSNEYPRWRNWTFGYTQVSPDDVVRKIKKAVYRTNFRAPVPHAELGFGKAPQRAIYTTYNVREPLERLAETRNDNLGSDVAKYVNQVTIGGIPVTAVHYLDANDESDPIYGVNWRVIRPFVRKGWNMYRHPEKVAPKQHTVREIHYDTWMNYICYNLRECFVGSKA